MRGKVEKYIREKIDKEGALLLALVDPDKYSFEKGAKLAQAANEGGADIILVGGSVGAHGMILDKTTKMIKESVDVPVLLFPGSPTGVTHYADATYFMYVMNARDINWVTTAQIQGAPTVKRLGIEPIPTAYIILEPGRAVGWISNANLIPRDKPDLAAATALAGEYMGAHIIITDSGSGANVTPAVDIIKAIKSVVSVPYFYAGGCRTPEHCKTVVKAGADGIHVGTAFEGEDSYDKIVSKVKSLVQAVKESGKAKAKEEKEKKRAHLLSSLRFGSLDFLRLRKKWERKVEKVKEKVKRPKYDIDEEDIKYKRKD